MPQPRRAWNDWHHLYENFHFQTFGFLSRAHVPGDGWHAPYGGSLLRCRLRPCPGTAAKHYRKRSCRRYLHTKPNSLPAVQKEGTPVLPGISFKNEK